MCNINFNQKFYILVKNCLNLSCQYQGLAKYNVLVLNIIANYNVEQKYEKKQKHLTKNELFFAAFISRFIYNSYKILFFSHILSFPQLFCHNHQRFIKFDQKTQIIHSFQQWLNTHMQYVQCTHNVLTSLSKSN